MQDLSIHGNQNMKYSIGDRVTVNDRGMKTNSFNGEVIGLEPHSDVPVYNVKVEMKDKHDKLTGKFRTINFLGHQLSKAVDV